MTLLELLRSKNKEHFTNQELADIVISDDYDLGYTGLKHEHLQDLIAESYLVPISYEETEYDIVPMFNTDWRLVSEVEVEVVRLARLIRSDMTRLIRLIKMGEVNYSGFKPILSEVLDQLEAEYVRDGNNDDSA